MSYIMALDQGTTSSRCILFNHEGQMVSSAAKEFTQYYPKPGLVEHDPMEIWSSQLAVSVEAMAKIGADASQIAAIGITNQRETTICWNRKTGLPIANAIVWQCRRTAERIDLLKQQPELIQRIREKTGLIADAYFSASKLEWLLDHVEGARELAEAGDLLFGTVDSWLIWKLTGGRVHATDYTNASRTMLFNIHTLSWDEELLELFRIPAAVLPEVHPSGFCFGETDPGLFGHSIPITGAAGDQQSALFGQCCFTPGDVKNTYGTGCFLLMNTGSTPRISANGLLTSIAAGLGEKADYVLEGSVFVAGASVQWLRDEMHLISNAAESESLAESVPDTAGVYVVPAFTGLGAPYWDPYARGTVVGITRGCKREHFVRATLESIAYQTSQVISAMEGDAGVKLSSLKVDGGASANNFLMQFQADIIGTPVVRPTCIETTALGAAYLAGLTVGYWSCKEEIRENWKAEREFTPAMPEEKRSECLEGYERAVRAARIY